jgi:hypothetical protein
VLGGSLVAGIGSLGLAACSSHTDKAESSQVNHATPNNPTIPGARHFVSATSFVFPQGDGPFLASGWPCIVFPNTPADAMASFTLPTNASVIALDLIWMSEDSGPGSVRWVGGIQWAQSDIALDSDAAGTDWAAAVASVPTAPRSPVTTRLGEFVVNHDSPCLNLHLTREADHADDDFDKSVRLLGVSVSVVATVPFRVPPAGILIPESVRLRGVNISPGPQHFYTPSVWAGLWQTWDWDTWIKPIIDDARSIGANSIRTIGNTLVVTSGMISADEYLNRWRQLLDYTASQGMYFFPCGGDLGHWGHVTTLSAAEDIYRSWSDLLAEYSHVVGVDISNEASAKGADEGIGYNQPEPWPDVIKRLGELVREVSHKPITHSRSLNNPLRWANGSIYLDTLSDFISIHCYYSPGREDADALHAAPWGSGKQLLIGETGAGLDLNSEERSARYRAVKALVEASPDNVGALAWSGYDLKDKPRDQKGLFDRNRRPRSDITSVFETFPIAR